MMTVVTYVCCLCVSKHPSQGSKATCVQRRARRLLCRLTCVLLPWPGMRLLLDL